MKKKKSVIITFHLLSYFFSQTHHRYGGHSPERGQPAVGFVGRDRTQQPSSHTSPSREGKGGDAAGGGPGCFQNQLSEENQPTGSSLITLYLQSKGGRGVEMMNLFWKIISYLGKKQPLLDPVLASQGKSSQTQDLTCQRGGARLGDLKLWQQKTVFFTWKM